MTPPTKKTRFEQIVLGDGVNVTLSYQTDLARLYFLGALMAIAPHVHAELLNIKNLQLAVDAYRTPDSGYEVASLAAADKIAAAVRDWQGRYHLSDQWIHDAAISTLYRAVVPIINGLDETYTIESIVPTEILLYLDILSDTAPWADELAQISKAMPGASDYAPLNLSTELPVFFDDLNLSVLQDANATTDDFGVLGTFDPRTEQIEAATEKLLNVLRPRVRQVLKDLAAEDREKYRTRKPKVYRSIRPFVWLVRVQVLQETYKQIAYDANKKQSAVEKAVREAREHVGLS